MSLRRSTLMLSLGLVLKPPTSLSSSLTVYASYLSCLHKSDITWVLLSESNMFLMFTDYGVSSYDIGTGFGHFAISTQDVSRAHALIF